MYCVSTQAFANSALPQRKVPNVLEYLWPKDTAKQETVREFAANTQFIVVHNLMDFASVDLVRRCRCAVVGHSDSSSSGFAASCTGCV